MYPVLNMTPSFSIHRYRCNIGKCSFYMFIWPSHTVSKFLFYWDPILWNFPSHTMLYFPHLFPHDRYFKNVNKNYRLNYKWKSRVNYRTGWHLSHTKYSRNLSHKLYEQNFFQISISWKEDRVQHYIHRTAWHSY